MYRLIIDQALHQDQGFQAESLKGDPSLLLNTKVPAVTETNAKGFLENAALNNEEQVNWWRLLICCKGNRALVSFLMNYNQGTERQLNSS